jgi:catechol 2,3-dioxygenase-like lactoylglutathione lyase family enzyme
MPRFSVLVLGLLLALIGHAQIRPANSVGVSMGHLHYFVDDAAANRDFWVALGGTAVPFAAGEIVRMPGVLVLISESAAEPGSSVIDHVAFRVQSLDDLARAGFELEMTEAYPGIASIYTPSGDRVELFEEGTATNVGFDVAAEDDSSTADQANAGRHNRPLVGRIDSHHLHFYLPERDVVAARDWYVEHFGAVPGQRWRYDAADLPGMNLNFSATDPARAPSGGHSLNHIGFEIRNLEAFCEQLTAAGIEFDQTFQRINPDFAVAVLTDPWGTTLELTEGLGSF